MSDGTAVLMFDGAWITKPCTVCIIALPWKEQTLRKPYANLHFLDTIEELQEMLLHDTLQEMLDRDAWIAERACSIGIPTSASEA